MPSITTSRRLRDTRAVFGNPICLDDIDRITGQDMRNVLWIGRSPTYRNCICNRCLDRIEDIMDDMNIRWHNLDLRNWRANQLIFRLFREFGVRRYYGSGSILGVRAYEDPIGW